MNSVFTSGALAVLLSAGAAFSQDGGFGVGVAGVGQFPAGDFENSAGFGYGALGSIEVGGSGLSITARAGYIQHLERGDYSRAFTPILGGLKLSTLDRSVYLAGEAGAVLTKIAYSGPNILLNDVDETNLGWGVGVGSEVGPLDLRFCFNVWDSQHMSESMTLGVSLGVTFWMF